MLWDNENNVLPFIVGSHLGVKQVLNIDGGWYYHHDVTASSASANDSIKTHDQLS